MKQDRYVTMRRNIFACMIFLPVVPFILVLGTEYCYFTTSLESSTVSSRKRIIEDLRQMIDSFLSERKAELEFMMSSFPYDTLATLRDSPKSLLSYKSNPAPLWIWGSFK